MDRPNATAAPGTLQTSPSPPLPKPCQPTSQFEITVPTVPNPDVGLVQHVVELVNDIFTKDEGDLWDPTKAVFLRTNADDITTYLQAGELALVWRRVGDSDRASRQYLSQTCVGCARLHRVDDKTGVVSMLVCHDSLRGLGVGRHVMGFGEVWFKDSGATAIRVELMVPLTRTHPSKTRLAGWYTRMGYSIVRTESLGVTWPRLVPLLAGPSMIQIWEKSLV